MIPVTNPKGVCIYFFYKISIYYYLTEGIINIAMLACRVHNRWLRNRFEKKISQSVDTSDATYKRSLEYLFMGEHPALPGELDRAVEHGFRPPGYLASVVSPSHHSQGTQGRGYRKGLWEAEGLEGRNVKRLKIIYMLHRCKAALCSVWVCGGIILRTGTYRTL